MTTKKAADLLRKEVGDASFGSFLRAARTAIDATQAEMAAMLNVSKSVICDIEKGRQLVSPTLALKIAKKADLSERLALKLCLQDQLKKAKIKYSIDVKDAA
jgi:DNA-binding XRE family transcriptional regulator